MSDLNASETENSGYEEVGKCLEHSDSCVGYTWTCALTLGHKILISFQTGDCSWVKSHLTWRHSNQEQMVNTMPQRHHQNRFYIMFTGTAKLKPVPPHLGKKSPWQEEASGKNETRAVETSSSFHCGLPSMSAQGWHTLNWPFNRNNRISE